MTRFRARGHTRAAGELGERPTSSDRRFDHLPIHHGFALASIEGPEILDDPEALAATLEALGRLEMPCILVTHDRLHDAVAAAGLERMLRRVALLPRGESVVGLACRADFVVADSSAIADACAAAGTPIATVRLDAAPLSPYPGSVDAVPSPIARP